MNIREGFLIALIVLVAGMGSCLYGDNSSIIADEEYEVYSKVILLDNSGWPYLFSSFTTPFKLQDKYIKVTERNWWSSKEIRIQISDDLFADFNQKNLQSGVLENKFLLPGKNIFFLPEKLGRLEISLDEEKNRCVISKEMDSRDFSMSDRAVIIHLSRVGFNSDHSQALVFCYVFSGGRPGGYYKGSVFLLAKTGGKWRVKNESVITELSIN